MKSHIGAKTDTENKSMIPFFITVELNLNLGCFADD